MSDFRQVAAFAAGLYRQRADIASAGYLRRDPMALLVLRPGRVDPCAIYDRLRRGGRGGNTALAADARRLALSEGTASRNSGGSRRAARTPR